MFCYKKGKGVYHTWDVGFREFTVFLYLCRILGSSESRAKSTYISIVPCSHRVVFALLPVRCEDN